MKKFLISVLIALTILGTIAFAGATKARAEVINNNDLADLIVLNGLYGGYYNNNFNDLAGLIATNNILNNGTTSTNDLANLIVLNGLYGSNNVNDLAGLIAVNNLFH